MERNRRKFKNDKWMMYGFYKVKKNFKSSRSKEFWLKEREYIKNNKNGKNEWLKVYLYHTRIKKKKLRE